MGYSHITSSLQQGKGVNDCHSGESASHHNKLQVYIYKCTFPAKSINYHLLQSNLGQGLQWLRRIDQPLSITDSPSVSVEVSDQDWTQKNAPNEQVGTLHGFLNCCVYVCECNKCTIYFTIDRAG